MRSVTLLEKILSNVHKMLHYAAHELTGEEWLVRPGPGRNTVGYMVWHMPRVQDNIVQLWIQGIPEVAHRERWARWGALRPLGVGVGITLAEADEIAATVRPADALAYADEVHQEVLAWLGQLGDEDLEQVPDARKHLAPYPEYQTAGFHEDTDDLIGQPVWSLLMRPCIGHIHRHLGELMLAKELLRQAG